MKKRLLAILLLLACGHAVAQVSNTFTVSAQTGTTVAAKTTAAQALCNSNTLMPCRIVFDQTLNGVTLGTMPARCSQCIWQNVTTAGALPNAVFFTFTDDGSTSKTIGTLASLTTSNVLITFNVLVNSGQPWTSCTGTGSIVAADSSGKVLGTLWLQSPYIPGAPSTSFGNTGPPSAFLSPVSTSGNVSFNLSPVPGCSQYPTGAVLQVIYQ